MPVLKDDVVRLRFGLTHHSHTGRRVHKSHTSYPLLAVLLLMIGVMLASVTLQVRAADITVTAVANGPAPVQPAIILSPENDNRFTDPSIPVTGTCQPGYYIKLFRNEIFSGATLCTAGGTFSITTDLFEGRNDLQARTFNIADDEGPSSAIVTVWYDPPVTPGPGEPVTPGQPVLPPGSQTPGHAPFYLSSEYFFKAAYSGQRIKWDFKIFGGQGPFTAYAVWGDGFSDMIQNIEGDTFTIEHSYETLKDKREYFSVTVRVHDAYGRRASLQLISIMNDRNVIGGALVRPGDGGVAAASARALSGVLKLVWSAYGIIILMGICFWLGERRGYSVRDALYRRRRRAT